MILATRDLFCIEFMWKSDSCLLLCQIYYCNCRLGVVMNKRSIREERKQTKKRLKYGTLESLCSYCNIKRLKKISSSIFENKVGSSEKMNYSIF